MAYIEETDLQNYFRQILQSLKEVIKEAEGQHTLSEVKGFVAKLNNHAFLLDEAIDELEYHNWIKEEVSRLKKETRRIKEHTRRLKEEAARTKAEAITLFLEAGLSAEQISTKFGLPLEQILALRKS
jgi:predicted nuclease with TOPRIM domain